MWVLIEELVASGTTLLLTTQYLDEADHLADRIAVIDTGRVIAEGTSDELKRQVGGERVELTVGPGGSLDLAREVLGRHADGEVRVEVETRRLTAPVTGGARRLADVVRELDAAEIELEDLGVRRPTLDDVFLTLTGHAAEQAREQERERESARALAEGAGL